MLTLTLQFFLIHSQAKRQYDMQIALTPLMMMVGTAVVGYIISLCIPIGVGIVADVALRLAIYAAFTLVLVGLLWRDRPTRVYLVQFRDFMASRLPVLRGPHKPGSQIDTDKQKHQ